MSHVFKLFLILALSLSFQNILARDTAQQIYP